MSRWWSLRTAFKRGKLVGCRSIPHVNLPLLDRLTACSTTIHVYTLFICTLFIYTLFIARGTTTRPVCPCTCKPFSRDDGAIVTELN